MSPSPPPLCYDHCIKKESVLLRAIVTVLNRNVARSVHLGHVIHTNCVATAQGNCRKNCNKDFLV